MYIFLKNLLSRDSDAPAYEMKRHPFFLANARVQRKKKAKKQKSEFASREYVAALFFSNFFETLERFYELCSDRCAKIYTFLERYVNFSNYSFQRSCHTVVKANLSIDTCILK